MREQFGTKNPIISDPSPMTLLGGADLGTRELNISLSRAPLVVAADGGADHALAHGANLAAVIGDLDSISDAARKAFSNVTVLVDDTETTDFEKLLTRVDAPLLLGCGFLGGRLDHIMGVLNVLARHPSKRVILLSDDDVVFLAPARVSLNLPIGTRIGLLPMGDVAATSSGLRWNLDNLSLHPTRLVSSSNEVSQKCVKIESVGPLIVTLPLAQIDAAIAAVREE